MRLLEKVLPGIFFVLLILLWEIASNSFETHQFILPPPSGIFDTIIQRWDRLLYHAQITFLEMIGGLTLAFAAAFPLGWLMWYRKSASRILQPLFVFIQCIPMFALAPIMVLWFGWNYTAIIVPTALMIFFPLTMNIFHGFQTVPYYLLDYFRVNQATTWQTLIKLQIPWALPHIFAGLRVSAAIAGIGAIAGEWAGAQSGLGMLMLESRRATDLETTFAALLVLSLLSGSFYTAIILLEKKISKRHVSSAMKRMAALLACIGLVLGGCAEKKPAPQQTRLLLDWLPNPNHVPLYVGIEKGFFRQNTIDLKILKIHDPSDAIPYLTNGQAELAVYYTPDTLRANAKGADLQPIGVLIDRPLNALIYCSDTNIKQPSDLAGKTIGYCLGISSEFLKHILKTNQIDSTKEMNISFDLVGSLGAKKVDAIYGAYWNIESEHLRSLGVETHYFDSAELGAPTHPELIILLKRNTQDTHFIQAFQKAMQQSIDYSTLHPDEAFKIYLRANPDKSDKTIAWEKRAWYATYPLLANNQQIDLDAWNKFAAWLYSNDLLR